MQTYCEQHITDVEADFSDLILLVLFGEVECSYIIFIHRGAVADRQREEKKYKKYKS